jgi:hypothetical protein
MTLFAEIDVALPSKNTLPVIDRSPVIVCDGDVSFRYVASAYEI